MTTVSARDGAVQGARRSQSVDDPAAEREYQQQWDAKQDQCVAGAAFHAAASVAAISAGSCPRLPIFTRSGDRLPIAKASSAPTATIAAPT